MSIPTPPCPPLVIMTPGISGTVYPAHPVDAIPEIARQVAIMATGDRHGFFTYERAAILAMQLLAAQQAAWFSNQQRIGEALSRPHEETLQVLSFSVHRIVSESWPDECEQEAQRRGEETDRQKLTAA